MSRCEPLQHVRDNRDVHAQEDYARMLLARDGRGDAEQARNLIEEDLGTYRELGMDSYAERASALAREGAASSRP